MQKPQLTPINNPLKQTIMQNLQPQTQMPALLAELTADLTNYLEKCNEQNPYLNATYNLINFQTLTTNDNAGCLNLIITFNAPDINDACDIATDSLTIAKTTILEYANHLNAQNPKTTIYQNPIPGALHIYCTIDELTYFNALITITDCSIYIHCTYNQQ